MQLSQFFLFCRVCAEVTFSCGEGSGDRPVFSHSLVKQFIKDVQGQWMVGMCSTTLRGCTTGAKSPWTRRHGIAACFYPKPRGCKLTALSVNRGNHSGAESDTGSSLLPLWFVWPQHVALWAMLSVHSALRVCGGDTGHVAGT